MRKDKIAALLFLAVLALLCTGLSAGAGELKYGADLRLRQTRFDDIPIAPGTWATHHFFRIRPRVWAQYGISENAALRVRIINEFRHHVDPDTDAWEFPDEWVVDELYLDLRNLAGGSLDLRIGRQELIYGTGKIILEGTPGDDSRTIYMDAVKITWKGFENLTIDLLGIYDSAENVLAVNGQDRNLTNLTGADADLEMNELGGGLYLKHNGFSEAWPFEAYYLFKQQAEYGNVEAADISTIGARVMPRLTDALSGNLELAYQIGSQGDMDISGYMVDAKLTAALAAMEQYQARASLGLYLVSGDDPGTADKYEGWSPPFARWPQYSELYVYSLATEPGSLGNWQNFMMPYAELTLAPIENLSTAALVGYMTAPEDTGYDGSDRGILFTLWNRFTLAKGILRAQDVLNGHLLVEMVKPGGFYMSDDASFFLRGQLMYSL